MDSEWIRIGFEILQKIRFQSEAKPVRLPSLAYLDAVLTPLACRPLIDGNYPKVHFRFSILCC